MKVVFVMTGDCNDRTHPGFRTYEKIAAASFGQVFHLEKTDVKKVLNYVRHSVALKKVHLMYEVRERGGTNLRLIPVDQHLNELTLSLSGDKDDGDFLDISLTDPKGTKVERAHFSNESGTIDLNNIKLIRITNPLPGIWRVRTSSRLKHVLRVLGHGAIDFKYGFSTRPIDRIELAHPRPISHQTSYLLVNMTGLPPPGTVFEISLVDYFGKELFSKPATINKRNPYLYFMGPFVPPKGLFFVRVKGEDDKSYEFLRIAPTATSSVQAGGPRLILIHTLFNSE
ncbi:unnamed protein product [Anisakis simplex]|uniref:Hemicentin/VWA7 galactose-binding domain-containing protein n=1 Tax=Anisakis simplex TaxID=6269 RepID=A0A3P6S8K9_ANISI|nr:unnamed protein product [Anisakis simplex]